MIGYQRHWANQRVTHALLPTPINHGAGASIIYRLYRRAVALSRQPRLRRQWLLKQFQR